jgi:hypothetical protein
MVESGELRDMGMRLEIQRLVGKISATDADYTHPDKRVAVQLNQQNQLVDSHEALYDRITRLSRLTGEISSREG